MSDTTNDWQPQVGDPVAIITPSSRGTAPEWEPTTIDRVTKTLIVTATGRRFRRSPAYPGQHLEAVRATKNVWATQTPYLVHAASAKSQDVRARATFARGLSEVERIAREVCRQGPAEVSIADLDEAIANLTAARSAAALQQGEPT